MSCNLNNNKKDLETVSQGDFKKYDLEVKNKFYEDFVRNQTFRNGKRISAGRTEKEIEKCYEHLTSVGASGKTRVPDLRRYESIYILKDILTSSQCKTCKDYYVWNKKEEYLKEKIFCPKTGYLIILLKRDYIYKFVSAYFIEGANKRKRLIEECKKANT